MLLSDRLKPLNMYRKSNKSFEMFLDTKEKMINHILSLGVLQSLLIFPLLILFRIVNVFPYLKISQLLVLFVLHLIVAISNRIYSKKHTDNKNIKYILLLSIQLIVFLTSLQIGIILFITYCIVPLISCIYFNEKFTLKIAIISFVCMICSYMIRAFYFIDLPTFSEKISWGLKYCIGSTIEYILFIIFCYYLTKTIKKILINIYEKKEDIQNIQEQLYKGFANIIEAKDECTGQHIKRTSSYVELICQELLQKGIYPEEVNLKSAGLMVRAAPFHDLGKISVPDSILNKPAKLTDEEFSVIQGHPLGGATFINKEMGILNDPELLQMAKDMALFHHERMDGTGYPLRLIGEEIPVCARIMAVADNLDALLSVRPYKEAYSLEKSLQIIKEISGTALDPIIVDVLLDSRKKIEEMLESEEDIDADS